MAIRRYYLAEAGHGNTSEVATPKPIIDLILAEKYGWTPQEIDDIPEKWMAEMMMVLNGRINANAEIEMINKHFKGNENGGNNTGGHPTLGGKPKPRVLA